MIGSLHKGFFYSSDVGRSPLYSFGFHTDSDDVRIEEVKNEK